MFGKNHESVAPLGKTGPVERCLDQPLVVGLTSCPIANYEDGSVSIQPGSERGDPLLAMTKPIDLDTEIVRT